MLGTYTGREIITSRPKTSPWWLKHAPQTQGTSTAAQIRSQAQGADGSDIIYTESLAVVNTPADAQQHTDCTQDARMNCLFAWLLMPVVRRERGGKCLSMFGKALSVHISTRAFSMMGSQLTSPRATFLPFVVCCSSRIAPDNFKIKLRWLWR